MMYSEVVAISLVLAWIAMPLKLYWDWIICRMENPTNTDEMFLNPLWLFIPAFVYTVPLVIIFLHISFIFQKLW